MTNMATMPIYAKNLKNLLFQNQLIDDLETWYVALSMGVLPRSFKLWPWIDLDLFYIKVKFGYIGFCMGESEFFFLHSAKWVNEVEWVSKVKVILWPWPKVIQISKLNVWLWPVYSGERFRASWPSCLVLNFNKAVDSKTDRYQKGPKELKNDLEQDTSCSEVKLNLK